ncbi:MAG: hypothetical protein ACC652_04065 [Acidimicrobiales bacterium]
MIGMILAAVTWDPFLLGVLAVVLGVFILCGSVYLVLATNLGSRLGLLVATAGFFGWMFILGALWWTYGIGWQGDAPSWQVEEVWVGDEIALDSRDFVRELPTDGASVESAPPGDWELLGASDSNTTDAQSIADVAIIESIPEVVSPEDSQNAGTDDYTLLRGFDTGGDRYPTPFGWDFEPLGFFSTPHYFVTQVQPNEPAPAPDLNAAPEPRLPDPNAEVITTVMLRDPGNLRFPAMVVTIVSLIIFGITAEQLHRRDKAIMAAKASA